MELDMTCPVENCKEMTLLREDVKEIKDNVDEVKDCANKKVDKDSIRTYLLSFIGVLVILCGVAINMWAQTTKIPDLKEQGDKRESRLTVVETNQTAVMKALEKIQVNQETMMQQQAETQTMLREHIRAER